MQICKRCNKARKVREKIVKKRGKEWLIEFFPECGHNYEITEWKGARKLSKE